MANRCAPAAVDSRGIHEGATEAGAGGECSLRESDPILWDQMCLVKWHELDGVRTRDDHA